MSAQAQPVLLPPPVAMLQMIQGFWISRALYATAKFGIPDLLKNGPKSSEELARATGTHPLSLYRVLRALDGIGALAEDDGKRFELVLLVEAVLQPGKGTSFQQMCRSRYAGDDERPRSTEAEYRDLLAAAGLKLARSFPPERR